MVARPPRPKPSRAGGGTTTRSGGGGESGGTVTGGIPVVGAEVSGEADRNSRKDAVSSERTSKSAAPAIAGPRAMVMSGTVVGG